MTQATTNPPLTSLLRIDDVARELGVDALAARRLLARRRIRHFPQADGAHRVEIADLTGYIRGAMPDLNGPPVKAGWLSNAELPGGVGGWRSAMRRLAQAAVPEQPPAGFDPRNPQTYRLRPTPAVKAIPSS